MKCVYLGVGKKRKEEALQALYKLVDTNHSGNSQTLNDWENKIHVYCNIVYKTYNTVDFVGAFLSTLDRIIYNNNNKTYNLSSFKIYFT